jgi:hypothetical protein
VLAFAGGTFFFWVLAGQRLNGFGLFLRGASEIVSGYTEAMMWWQPTDNVDIVRFWGVAIAVCALVGYVVCKQRRLFGVLPLLGFAFIVFAATTTALGMNLCSSVFATRDLNCPVTFLLLVKLPR